MPNRHQSLIDNVVEGANTSRLAGKRNSDLLSDMFPSLQMDLGAPGGRALPPTPTNMTDEQLETTRELVLKNMVLGIGDYDAADEHWGCAPWNNNFSGAPRISTQDNTTTVPGPDASTYSLPNPWMPNLKPPIRWGAIDNSTAVIFPITHGRLILDPAWTSAEVILSRGPEHQGSRPILPPINRVSTKEIR